MSDLPYACSVCGWYGELEPSPPLMDAPCPNCGTLLFPRGSGAPRSGVLRRGSDEPRRAWTRREWLIAAGVGGAALGLYLLYRGKRRPRIGERVPIPDALELGDKRTTPPPCADVLSVLPELAQQQKTTVRLHPRPVGEGTSLPADASKLGGDFLWPRDEPWPTCPQHQIPFAGILQLRQADFPELPFKPGSDLLQVLWCPQTGHRRRSSPEPVLYWRTQAGTSPPLSPIPQPRLPSQAEIEEQAKQEALEMDLRWLQLFETKPEYIRNLARGPGRMPEPPDDTRLPRSFLEMPLRTDAEFQAARQAAAKLVEKIAGQRVALTFAEKEFLPRPCRLFPERVVEYPAELTAAQQEKLAKLAVPAPGEHFQKVPPIGVYQGELSVAPGTKLLGFGTRAIGETIPRCEQDHVMEHLVSIGSSEWDMMNMRRWLPLEEREVYLRALGAFDAEAMHKLPAPTALQFRHEQFALAIFICRQCKAWPTQTVERVDRF
ncbi:hypothetical protein AYO44_01365 [Planctomycetaceae bacterium SCGC AG-212-F19]|nr:hypothetical protein AYO44_01365 [Planctomycetaceae bacterium SCGC AG-212-F19]